MRYAKKTILILLLCVLLWTLLPPVTVQAATSGGCGSGVYWSYNDGTLTIYGNGPMSHYSKTSIPWYEWKDSIFHVEIQPGVTTIGNSAFEELKSLETVTIPDTVTAIGDNAFCWAERLTAVDIPGSVKTIGENAFWCCLDLAQVTFHEGLQVIEKEAFTFDRLITELDLPDSLRSIGYWAFGDCTNLTRVNIPAGIYALEDSVFSGCTALKTVSLEDGLTAIGNSTFAYCFALENVTIPGSVQTIGDTAFYLCEVLGTVTFTGNPPVISGSAFAGANATARYPQCNTDWAYYTSGYGGNLTWESYSVSGHAYADTVVPATCLTWGYTRHVCTDPGCDMYYMDNYVSALGHSWDSGSTSGSKTTYTCTRCGEKRYEYSVSGSCGSSARWTLDTEEGILHITGTGTITSSAYSQPWKSYADSIRHVIIGKGITAIGPEAFWECGAIETIQIPDTVKSIGSQAFVWCSSLKSVTIPEGVTSIGDSTFWGCKSLAELNLPSTLKTIGEDVFYVCDSLKTLVIPEGVTSIGELAFWDCRGLEEITLPSTLTTLSKDLFNGCTSLHTVHLPDTLTTISEDAFSYCSALTTIAIPDSVTYIGDYAFYGCSKLSTIVIPGGVSYFGKNVFYGCNGLYRVRFAGEPPTFDPAAFGGCYATVQYPYVLRSAWSAHTGSKYGGSIYWSSFSVSGHNYTTTVKPATCENRGYTRYTCTDSGCTMYYMDNYTDALGHDWDAGYGSETSWTYTCTRCGKTRTIYTVGGSCGPNVKWRLNTEEGLLTIYGTGSMSNYSRTPPWASYMDSITRVVVESGVTSIGNYAFYEHSALRSVELPDTIRSLGLGSFAWAESLTSIHIPEGVTSIPEDCFWACLSMTEISLPSTIKTIGQGAFYSTDITSINLPAGLTDIGEDAFWQCYELTSVTIPSGVTVLRYNVFGSCSSLHTVNLHDGITEIQRSAFSGCSALTNMTLPANLRTVGINALSRIAVPSLTFPKTLEFLDIGVLSGASVKELHFLGDAPEFDAEAFSGYSGTAYYPMDNPTWSEDVRRNYDGNITWKPVAPDPEDCRHQWSGGVCIYCGTHYVAFQSATISLAGNIALNFYVELGEGILADESAYMSFTMADGSVRTAALLGADTSVKDGVTRYIFTCELHAKQMADMVVAQMHLGDGTAVGGSKEYSVVTYAGYIISNEDVYAPYYPTLIPLLKTMLNYGTYSQIHFGYNTGNPANAGLGLDLEQVTVDQLLTYKPKTAGSLTGLKAASVTLILRSETVLRFYFSLSAGYNINDYRFALAGKTVWPQYNPDNGRYYVEVTNIAAKNLDQAYGVTVTNADGTESLSVVASARSYGYQVLANPTYFTQDLKDLVMAMYAYAMAANQYFG